VPRLRRRVYTFPAIVAVAAIMLGRERAAGRRLTALAPAVGGPAVVVGGGAAAGRLDPLGAALGLGAAVVYSAYILVGESLAGRVSPRLLAALVCTGAAAPLTVGSALTGELRPGELTAAACSCSSARPRRAVRRSTVQVLTPSIDMLDRREIAT
jgi:drug/metabolite transporter (DMT)-like permease